MVVFSACRLFGLVGSFWFVSKVTVPMTLALSDAPRLSSQALPLMVSFNRQTLTHTDGLSVSTTPDHLFTGHPVSLQLHICPSELVQFGLPSTLKLAEMHPLRLNWMPTHKSEVRFFVCLPISWVSEVGLQVCVPITSPLHDKPMFATKSVQPVMKVPKG